MGSIILRGVSLVLDVESAELGRYANPQTPEEEECHEVYLRATANASISTADGVFADSGEVTLHYSPSGGVNEIWMEKAFEEMGGSFSVALEEGETGAIIYEIGGADEACAGAILLKVSRGLGGGRFHGHGGDRQLDRHRLPGGHRSNGPRRALGRRRVHPGALLRDMG